MADDMLNQIDGEVGRSTKVSPFRHVWSASILVAILGTIGGGYNGVLWYVGWRYDASVPLGWPQWDVWVALWTRLPFTMLLELFVWHFVALVLFLVVMKFLFAGWRRSRQLPAGIKDLHGSARWATVHEIRHTELLPAPMRGISHLAKKINRHGLQSVSASRKTSGEAQDSKTRPPTSDEKIHHGVVVGGWQEKRHKPIHLLKDGGKNHILAFAPTRSGKGVGLVLPTLLDGWRESALVFDPKGEAWELTAGFRKKELGQRVYRFDPAGSGEDVAKFNPLAEVRVGTDDEVADAQNIAQMVIDPDGKGLSDHWDRTSNSLLAAVILHTCYVAHEKDKVASFGDVERWFGDPGDAMDKKLNALKNHAHLTTNDGKGKAHPMIAREAQSNLDRDKKERSSVISTALSHLTLYRDPTIARNTGRSDFTIADLMDGDDPATVYFVVRPADQERLRPLIRLVLTQIVRRLTRDMEFHDGQGHSPYKHRLLLLIDEFTSLKRLGIIEDALPYAAGYGIKAFLIVQDLQQLLAVYGQEESLVGNCAIRVCYAPNKLETAQIISKWAGDRTIVANKYSRSGKRQKLRAESVSESVQEYRRALILPDEVMRLTGATKDREGNITAPGDMLIFGAGMRPIYGTQVLYFQFPELKRRSEIKPPEWSDSQDARTLRNRAESVASDVAPKIGYPNPSEVAQHQHSLAAGGQ